MGEEGWGGLEALRGRRLGDWDGWGSRRWALDKRWRGRAGLEGELETSLSWRAAGATGMAGEGCVGRPRFWRTSPPLGGTNEEIR